MSRKGSNLPILLGRRHKQILADPKSSPRLKNCLDFSAKNAEKVKHTPR
jgi:hypothetical protein